MNSVFIFYFLLIPGMGFTFSLGFSLSVFKAPFIFYFLIYHTISLNVCMYSLSMYRFI